MSIYNCLKNLTRTQRETLILFPIFQSDKKIYISYALYKFVVCIYVYHIFYNERVKKYFFNVVYKIKDAIN